MSTTTPHHLPPSTILLHVTLYHATDTWLPHHADIILWKKYPKFPIFQVFFFQIFKIFNFSNYAQIHNYFVGKNWSYVIKLNMANFSLVNINSTSTSKIQLIHDKFSTDCTAEIGDFSQFCPIHNLFPWATIKTL
jgi:hypothetical protein